MDNQAHCHFWVGTNLTLSKLLPWESEKMIVHTGQVEEFIAFASERELKKTGLMAPLLERPQFLEWLQTVNQLGFSGDVFAMLDRMVEIQDLELMIVYPKLKRIFPQDMEKIKVWKILEHTWCDNSVPQEDSQEFIKEILPIFLKHYLERVFVIEKLLNEEKQDISSDLISIFHKFSGSAKSYGFPKTGELAAKCCSHLKAHRDEEGLNYIQKSLCQEFLELSRNEIVEHYQQP